MEKLKNIPSLRFPEFDGEWKKTKFDQILEITRLAGYEYSTYWQEDENKEIIALRGYNIGKGKLELNNLGYISKELSLKLIRSKLYKGDIVYPCVGTIGNAVVIEEDDKYHIQQNIAKITPKENTSPYFITQFLMSDLGLNEVYKFNATSSQPNVLVGSLRNFEITLPPSFPEQTKIASFLTAVDDKLTALKQKKNLLEQYKKGVMQKIFSQELRFRDDNGNDYPDWEEKKLGDIVKEYNVKSIVNDQYVVLSSSMGGIKLQSDYFTKDVSSKDNTGYKIVPKGYFTYRSMSDTGSFTFNIQNIVDIGIVSPAYPVFKTIDSIVSEYLSFYLNNSNKIINDLLGLKEGGTRYALSFSKFSRLEVILPSFQEQTKIGNFLSAIDDKINHCGVQIEKIEVWKKGLLQQLFC